jgi:VWFA-related protein
MVNANRHLVCLCLALAGAATAQEQPEIASRESPVTFSSKVNLVSVPVVVRDSKGHAVGNLRQEDFRLFDKGKPQVITRFSVQTSGAPGNVEVTSTQSDPAIPATSAPPASPEKAFPDRYVAYVFDDVHLNFQNLVPVRTAAERHFATLAPASRAAIFTISGRVTLDFTDDRDKLREALSRIAPGPSATPPPEVDCPPGITDYEADRIVNVQDDRALAAATAEVLRCYPGLTSAAEVAMSIAHQMMSANHIDSGASIGVLTTVIQRLAVMPGSRAIMLLSPGYLVLGDSRAQEAELLDRAIRANVVINSLNARGLYTALLGDAASSRDGLNSIRRRYQFESAQADEDVMAEMADGTGGKYFHNDNGFDEGLTQLASPPEFTYVLGFAPQDLKFDGSYHGLKVTLVNAKGMELQARRGYWAPNRAAGAEEQAREEIREAVFSLEEVRDIPLDVTTDFFRTTDTAAELTVNAHLDLNGLKFRTADNRSEDTLTVVTGLFDQNGRYVKGIQKVIDLRVREQTLEKVLGSGLAVKETFEIAPGRYVVRVVVRDSEGQTMSARNGTVNIQ